MKVDITGEGNRFVVRNSETQEELTVKSVSLYLNKDGICEAMLYVGVGLLQVSGVPRSNDGVRAG